MKTFKYKMIFLSLSAAMLLTSCASSYDAIGTVDMLSNKSLDTTINYKQLTFNSGITKKLIKHSTADNLDKAIDNVVNQVPGGLYITNVTIYVVDNGYYAVSGNVWGIDKNGAMADSLSISNQKQAEYSSANITNYGTKKP